MTAKGKERERIKIIERRQVKSRIEREKREKEKREKLRKYR